MIATFTETTSRPMPTSVPRWRSFAPAATSMTNNVGANSIAVPKSGCFRISPTGTNMMTNGTINPVSVR